jgi:tetratricopeptide (TPR) repeat protein
LNFLASIQQLQGDPARAVTLYEESLAMYQAIGDQFGIGVQLDGLASVARDQGNYRQAKLLYRESLRVRHALMDRPGFGYCFEGLAVVAAAEGQLVRAARLFSAAQCLRGAIGTFHISSTDRTVNERTIAAVRAMLGEDAFAAAWAAGQALALEDAVALGLEGHAEV